jgi:hypothetical protein
MSDQNSESELIFEDVPVATRPGIYASAVAQWLIFLREHEGKTAKFPEPVGPGVSTAIKGGHGYGARAGEFKVASRRRDAAGAEAPENRVWLYVTFMGDEAATDA